MSVPDKGPWFVYPDTESEDYSVWSDDFTHDVVLRVTGDFGFPEDKKEYCEWLAKTLNESRNK